MAEQIIKVQIIQKRLEAEDIVSLVLRGDDLPAYEAGAHIDVHLRPGLVRQYSLCPPLAEPGLYEIAVLREPNSRGGSITVHDTLQVGQTLEISAPRNHFPLDPTKGRRVLLAGGIGITPILSMAHQSLREGCSFAMHYCARTAAKMAFTKRIKQSAIAPYCIFHLDDGPDPQKLDMGAALANPAQSDQLYVCGPAGFIEAALTSATANGWREPQVHREFFSAPATERDASADEAFTVVLARLGLNVLVPSGVSIVEALEAEGVSVPTSCAEGICGMCVVPVLEGTPEHRDFVLTDDEHARNDRITACCSRSKTPILVLDL